MLPTNSYNPSLVRFQGRLLLSYRHHSRKDWRTELGICVINESCDEVLRGSSKPIKPPDELKDNSWEDLRFHTYQGALWFSCTVSQWPAAVFRSVVVIGELLETETHWKIHRFCIPQFGRNDFTNLEKNWVFWEHQSKLYCLYMTNKDQQTILEFDESFRVEQVHKSKALPWKQGPPHGGAICRSPNGNYLHFFNARTGGTDRASHRYNIGCAELAGEPPFEVLRISASPLLLGEEGYCLDKNPRYKNNVVFSTGAIYENGQFLLAHGFNDAQCRIAKFTEAQLKLK